MTFYWPHAFWLLLIPFGLLARDLLRRRTVSAHPHPKITLATVRHSSLVLGHSSFRRGAPRTRIFLYLGLVAATAAVARPQWGRLEEPVFDQAREIIIALDLSRSMLSQDVKPARLERARLLITGLLERLKGERVGLVVFSGTAFLQSPLSSDYEILREFLPILGPDYLPEGGTDYDALLSTAVSAFGGSNAADRFLIILSDGEAQTDTWRKHIDELKAKGIRVLGLGIGTSEGAMIPDGSGAFMKDERGAVVLSKLNPVTLRELAGKTNGVYADASSWVDLAQLIQATVDQGRRGDFKESSRIRLAERFQWPLAAALAFFLLSFWREFPVRPKPRPIQLAVKTAAVLLLFPSAFVISPSSFAAEGAAPAPSASAPVTQIITRLAARATTTAADYAELARATLTYGERTKAANETVPEGPVRDALAAVSAGRALDPKAADWSGLREQLETLLPKKDPPKPKDDKSDQKKPEQNKNDPGKSGKDKQPPQNGDQDDQGQKGDSGQPGQSPPDKKDDASSRSSNGSPDPKKSGEGQESGKSSDNPGGSSSEKSDPADKSKGRGQSAFGDMKDDPSKPKPQPGDDQSASEKDGSKSGARPGSESAEGPGMQQVGGAPAGQSTDPARLDPSLTIPLQKLDQVKQGDSPAHLFKLLQGPSSAPPAPKGKDW